MALSSQELRNEYTTIFGGEATHTFFSPGRINLIGEHTDYNGGHVFPCAISLGTYAAVGPNDDASFRLYSANFPDTPIKEIDFSELDGGKDNLWTDYFKGMAQILRINGANFDQGLNVYINGTLPNGAGLSSSASLELLTGIILKTIYEVDVDMMALIYMGQSVENNFIGVNSGIMDQFAIGMGSPNRATLLDTNTMNFESIPVHMGNNVIVIMNTNKRRELADSKYNERRSECEKALALLQTKLDIKSLGELDTDTFDAYTYTIYDETLIKRARHAVFENQRTLKAETALQDGELDTFGRLISASGVSLAYDYEVTGKELDTLVKSALQQDGVLGARMTGAGFGGCAIAIVNRDAVDAFTEAVGKTYEETIGYAADFYIAEIAGGPSELE